LGDLLEAILAAHDYHAVEDNERWRVVRDPPSVMRRLAVYDVSDLLTPGPRRLSGPGLKRLVEWALSSADGFISRDESSVSACGRVLLVGCYYGRTQVYVQRVLAALRAARRTSANEPYDLGMQRPVGRLPRPIKLYPVHDLTRWRTSPKDPFGDWICNLAPTDGWLLLEQTAPAHAFVAQLLARARAPAVAHDAPLELYPLDRSQPIEPPNWLLKPVTLHRWDADERDILRDLAEKSGLTIHLSDQWKESMEGRWEVADYHVTNVPLGVALQLLTARVNSTFYWRDGGVRIEPFAGANHDGQMAALYPAPLLLPPLLAADQSPSVVPEPRFDAAGKQLAPRRPLARHLATLSNLSTAPPQAHGVPDLIGNHLLLQALPEEHLAWRLLLAAIADPQAQGPVDANTLVSVEADDEPLCDVLDRLARQYDLAIAIDRERIPGPLANRRITCDLRNVPLRTALAQWLAQDETDVVLRQTLGTLLLTRREQFDDLASINTRVHDVRAIVQRYPELDERQLRELVWDHVGREHWRVVSPGQTLLEHHTRLAISFPGRLLVRQEEEQQDVARQLLEQLARGHFDHLPRPALLFADDLAAQESYVNELLAPRNDAHLSYAAYWLSECSDLSLAHRQRILARALEPKLPARQGLALCRVLMAQPLRTEGAVYRLIARWHEETDELWRDYLLAAAAAQGNVAVPALLVNLLEKATPADSARLARQLRTYPAHVLTPHVPRLIEWGITRAGFEHDQACDQLFALGTGLVFTADSDAHETAATLTRLDSTLGATLQPRLQRAREYFENWDAFNTATKGDVLTLDSRHLNINPATPFWWPEE
jgi:hypothetical protein